MDCPLGKMRFASADAARRFRRAGNHKGKRNRIYRCHVCHGWHFTSAAAPGASGAAWKEWD